MTLDADAAPDPLLQTLDGDACRRLIAATEFGRLAVVEQGRPVIIVLNYAVHGDAILFRTTPDALITRLTDGNVAVHAVFEVDSAFPVGRSGWSVIAAGLLTREADPARVEQARTRVRAWAEGDRDVVLRLDVQELSGRHVGRV